MQRLRKHFQLFKTLIQSYHITKEMGYAQEKSKHYFLTKTRTKMFIAVLFIITKRGGGGISCLSIHQKIKCGISVQYYSAINDTHATWINLKNTVLKERNQ